MTEPICEHARYRICSECFPRRNESTAQRIARLTEMARRVWPNNSNVHIREANADDAVIVADTHSPFSLLRVHHPRALDMLEAALRAALDEQ